jgi:nitrogen fixation protein NifU and related proteins
MDSHSLYQEEILEHYRHPQNRGVIEDADVVQTERNNTCGDELTFSFRIIDGVIQEVKFVGEGCAISQAAASMLTEELENHSVAEAAALTKEDVLRLVGIDLGPTRLKCALLSLQAVKRAMTQEQSHSS